MSDRRGDCVPPSTVRLAGFSARGRTLLNARSVQGAYIEGITHIDCLFDYLF